MSTRTNAAGEKYALRGIYGTEPYWPQEKLKICVTGAGGFIGTPLLFSFLICAMFFTRAFESFWIVFLYLVYLFRSVWCARFSNERDWEIERERAIEGVCETNRFDRLRRRAFFFLFFFFFFLLFANLSVSEKWKNARVWEQGLRNALRRRRGRRK